MRPDQIETPNKHIEARKKMSDNLQTAFFKCFYINEKVWILIEMS